MKCAIGRKAVDVDWDKISNKSEYDMSYVSCTTIHPGRVYGCDEQARYFSVRDRRTYLACNVRLGRTAFPLEQYREHSALFVYQSAMYVKDS